MKHHKNNKAEHSARELQTDEAGKPPTSPPPPKGPKLAIVFLVILAALALLWIGASWGNRIVAGFGRLVASLTGGKEDSSETDGIQYYTCGMHPWVILPTRGICPICQMDLTPLDPAKYTGEVTIDPVVTQNIGVRVEPVTTGPLAQTIRTVGTVAYDETSVRDVNMKVSGWIEKLHVNYEWAEVQAGQPLFELYSPELFTAQEEYLSALKGRGQPSVEFLPGSAQDAENRLRSTRIRLEYFDVTPREIEALEKRGTPKKTVTLVSSHKGIVTEKKAYEGMRVEPGMRLYRIADLSNVWVLVTLYEFQQPYVALGQKAVMHLPYIPGQTFEGTVTYIYPYIDEKTREVNVRLEFENPKLLLKPGMFASVELRSVLAEERTLAPRSAVIDTGERQVAFVSLGEGKFEPRQVRMGIEAEGGMVEILDGLKPGELVVTSGQFLIDSESKIREALAKMVKGQPAVERGPPPELESELSTLPDKASQALLEALAGYFAVGEKLSDDTIDGITEEARKLASSLDALLNIEIPEDVHFWHRHTEAATVRGKALELVQEKDIEKARLKYSNLSVALAKLLRATGIPPSYEKEVQELHCPMYREGQGGSIWLQPGGKARNPFFGKSMLRCFDRQVSLPVTGAGGSTGTTRESSPGEPEKIPSGKPLPASKEIQGEVDRMVRAYLNIQSLMAKDEIAGTRDQLEILRKAAVAVSQGEPEELAALAGAVQKVVPRSFSEIGDLRRAFKPLSEAVYQVVKRAPPSSRATASLYKAYCPMVKASWLQGSKEIRNPYYGASMLTCGSIQETIQTREE